MDEVFLLEWILHDLSMETRERVQKARRELAKFIMQAIVGLLKEKN